MGHLVEEMAWEDCIIFWSVMSTTIVPSVLVSWALWCHWLMKFSSSFQGGVWEAGAIYKNACATLVCSTALQFFEIVHFFNKSWHCGLQDHCRVNVQNTYRGGGGEGEWKARMLLISGAWRLLFSWKLTRGRIIDLEWTHIVDGVTFVIVSTNPILRCMLFVCSVLTYRDLKAVFYLC